MSNPIEAGPEGQKQPPSSDQEPGFLSKAIDLPWLLARLQLVLLNPGSCWEKIRGESFDCIDLAKRYVLPLAAIPVLIVFAKVAVLGFSVPFIGTAFRMPFFPTLLYAAVFLGSLVAAMYMAAFIMQKLAARFDSQVERTLAFAIVAYASTPPLLLLFLPLTSGLLQVICWAAGVYGAYLWFQGMSVLIDTPQERRVPYFAATFGASVVASSVLFWLVNYLFMPSYPIFDIRKFNEQVELTPQEIQKGLEMFQRGLQKPE